MAPVLTGPVSAAPAMPTPGLVRLPATALSGDNVPADQPDRRVVTAGAPGEHDEGRFSTSKAKTMTTEQDVAEATRSVLRGVVDLVGAVGYYGLVARVPNV